MLTGSFLARQSKHLVVLTSAPCGDRPEPKQQVALAKERRRGEKDLREEEIWHLENVVSKDLRGCDVVSGDSSYISRYKSRLRRVEEN